MLLNLPKTPVSNRVSFHRNIEKGQTATVARLDGPGCVTRFWVVPTRYNADWETRRIYLRIYFDGETEPSVAAPLGDFFGVMHGKPYYPINTPYFSVQAESGYTCYFPMPFAREARFELEADVNTHLYMMVDYHRYPGQTMNESMRFHAQWRRENPTQSYGPEYLMLDAKGEGRLMGFFYGVRLNDNEDRWSHGGADNIYIDGQGAHPAYLRGIGGEDTFGVGFGGALHTPETNLYQGMPFYTHEDTGEARPAQRVTGYRFFENDAIEFHKSIQMRFGCMRNDICSTVYWYQSGESRPFYSLPSMDRLMPGTCLSLGEYDREPEFSGAWRLYGPYFNRGDRAMKQTLDIELNAAADLGDGMHDPDSLWKTEASVRCGKDRPHMVEYRAVHGFVDFRHAFRPNSRGVSPTEEGVAIARCAINSDNGGSCRFTLGYDDHMVLWVNDKRTDLGCNDNFATKEVTAELLPGVNRIVIKLSNTMGYSSGGWCFSFQANDAAGNMLLGELE